jgi:hypothetical protein
VSRMCKEQGKEVKDTQGSIKNTTKHQLGIGHIVHRYPHISKIGNRHRHQFQLIKIRCRLLHQYLLIKICRITNQSKINHRLNIKTSKKVNRRTIEILTISKTKILMRAKIRMVIHLTINKIDPIHHLFQLYRTNKEVVLRKIIGPSPRQYLPLPKSRILRW